jgi:hypothetical protein
MEITENTLKYIEINAKVMMEKSYPFNNLWYEAVIELVKEIRRLRNKYEKTKIILPEVNPQKVKKLNEGID